MIGKLRKIGGEEVKGSNNIVKRLPCAITLKLKIDIVDLSKTISIAQGYAYFLDGSNGFDVHHAH